MAIWRVALCLFAMAVPAWAEDSALRWKFTPGESQLYRMTQTARMDLNLNGENDVAAELQRVFDFRWTVESVDDEGTASVSVQVTRARLNVVGPGGQQTEYDTKADQQTGGFAATLAPLFKTLIESDLKAEINARGELSELRISEDLEIVLSSKPAGKAVGQLGSADDLRSLLQLGLPLLPEAESFAEGQQWEADSKPEGLALGSPRAHTVYRWDSTRDIDGQQLAVIMPTTSIRLNEKATADGEDMIASQKSESEILFNLTTGRLHSSQAKLNLELNSTEGEKTTSGTLEHSLSFEPLDELQAN
jgi:hypothetical protein